MSIIIRKKESGEVFDVPSKFTLEIKNTSPIFNNLGSKTVTTSLPFTNHNLKLLGFANRLDMSMKPQTKIPVLVLYGSYNREGMLYLSTAYNTDKTFGVTIAFNEGIMYENMENILLTQLSNLPLIEKPVEELVADMQSLFTNDTRDNELTVFTVNLKEEEYTYKLPTGEEQTLSHNITLNNRDFTTNSLEITSTLQIVVDNVLKDINVPYGFGISPFIKVWKILELIFSHYGFRVNNNPFKDHYQLKCLCVLNNTIDAIVLGFLDYSQLLPAVSVMDFLQALYCRFGMKVYFDSNRNEVNLYLLKDLLSTTNSISINRSSFIDIDIATPKQLKLSAAKNLQYSSTETDSFEDFLEKYNNTVSIIYGADASYGVSPGIYYFADFGLFYHGAVDAGEDEPPSKLISSIHFDWNKKNEGLEIEEISSIDECLTFGLYILFGLSPYLHNSDFKINGKISDLMTDENKLAFAYGTEYYDYRLGSGSKYYPGYNYGLIVTYLYGLDGNRYTDREERPFMYALTFVGEDGAFNRFFKEYDAILRHSNHLVKYTAHIPLYDLSNPEFEVKRNIDGQLILLDKLDHKIGEQQSDATIEARTTKLYEPYDLEKEQYLPVPDPILYKWVRTNNKDVLIESTRAEVEAQVKAQWASNPGYQFESLTVKSISDPNPPGNTSFWFLPPTENQFNKGATVGATKHPLTVIYKHTYRIVTSGHSDDIKKEMEYSAWYYPYRI